MDSDVIKLFGVMLAIMLPVALSGGVVALISGLNKRSRGRRVSADADTLERLRERVAELERRDARVQEIEERLDFLERILPALREARPPLEPPGPPARQTPV